MRHSGAINSWAAAEEGKEWVRVWQEESVAPLHRAQQSGLLQVNSAPAGKCNWCAYEMLGYSNA